MRMLWAFGWILMGLAKALSWEDAGTDSRELGYMITEDGLVEASEGSGGGPPPGP